MYVLLNQFARTLSQKNIFRQVEGIFSHTVKTRIKKNQNFKNLQPEISQPILSKNDFVGANMSLTKLYCYQK